MPASSAWWQRVLFGWLPVSLLMQVVLARSMGWARPRKVEAASPGGAVSHAPLGQLRIEP